MVEGATHAGLTASSFRYFSPAATRSKRTLNASPPIWACNLSWGQFVHFVLHLDDDPRIQNSLSDYTFWAVLANDAGDVHFERVATN